jgi:hypothetical protein
VRLTLTYRGHLPATQRGVSRTKAALREAFHPQIAAQIGLRLGRAVGQATTDFNGHAFVAPAHQELRTAAELDVLLLTPASSRTVGDVDNRLKTLIDGLTRPANAEQMRDFTPPVEGAPTYCLMDDDQLVKRLTVDARRWFEPGIPLDEALVVVTANIILGDNADMSSPTANIFLVL